MSVVKVGGTERNVCISSIFQLWLTLSQKYLTSRGVDWSQCYKTVFLRHSFFVLVIFFRLVKCLWIQTGAYPRVELGQGCGLTLKH